MHRKVQSSKLKVQSRNNIIRKIIEQKKKDVAVEKSKRSNVFVSAIYASKKGGLAVIAEVKFASPSEGDLGSQRSLLMRIKQYEKAGVDAISIVTEKHFFKGDPVFVQQAKKVTNLPILQKDFVVDASQIYKAKQVGADAILLIARILTKEKLINFVNFARQLAIEPVVEVHNEKDLAKAFATKTRIIAVNARDLDTFRVDVNRACTLLKKVPDLFIKLGFSGIASKKEVDAYVQAGADGVLIGTSLMKTKNITKFLEELR